MSNNTIGAKHALPWLVGASVLVVACAALAETAAPKYMDRRYKQELATGAPPEGAPIAKDVPHGPGSLTGTWFNSDIVHFDAKGDRVPDEPQRTAEGAPPPTQPWVAAIQEQRRKDAAAGHPYAGPTTRCLPSGIPGAMTGPQLIGFKIVEQPKVVTVMFERWAGFRQIFLNAKHNPHAKPSYYGDSIGHWEGDTLVVETTNINVDAGEAPHSPEMRVIERMRRVAKDRLEYKVTFYDPKTFTKPWSLPRRTMQYRPDIELTEFMCTNNRNAPDASGKTAARLENN